MRLRKIKNAIDILKQSEFVIFNYEENIGNFKKIFKNNNPIHIEIGTGKGNFIINMALNNPDINFIGIEKYDSVLSKAVLKLKDKKIDNLKLILMDAKNIDNIFSKEIDTLYLNFSDPWPKKRHAKRRLTSDYFLKKYDNIFIKDKKIIMKTDNRKLFEYSIISFTNEQYKIEEISLDLHKDYDNIVETEYETKFVSLNYPIYMIKVYK
ncbi:MAG: tRNA (guanosine(46)-N7)-methyltransferase TrmB [Bacilli bacterium]|nr:tRNA (guanosine(46)-N7)-methyltransferase TrmB [Bacilli bacterium]